MEPKIREACEKLLANYKNPSGEFFSCPLCAAVKKDGELDCTKCPWAGEGIEAISPNGSAVYGPKVYAYCNTAMNKRKGSCASLRMGKNACWTRMSIKRLERWLGRE